MALSLALCVRYGQSPPTWVSGPSFQQNRGFLVDTPAVTPAPSMASCTRSPAQPKQSTQSGWVAEATEMCSLSVLEDRGCLWRGNFTYTWPINMSFISFSCFMTLVRSSSSMLNAGGESGHPCLIFNLRNPSPKITRTYHQWGANQRTNLFRKKFQGGKNSSQNVGLVATPFLWGLQ